MTASLLVGMLGSSPTRFFVYRHRLARIQWCRQSIHLYESLKEVQNGVIRKYQPEIAKRTKMTNKSRNCCRNRSGLAISFMIVSLIGMWLFQQFILTPLMIREMQIPYSEFKAKIASGRDRRGDPGAGADRGDDEEPGCDGYEKPYDPLYHQRRPDGDPTLIPALDKAGVKYRSASRPARWGTSCWRMVSRWR